MEGFISRFPEERHCRNVSSYLCCSSLTKPLEKPTHPRVFGSFCLFIWSLFWQDVNTELLCSSAKLLKKLLQGDQSDITYKPCFVCVFMLCVLLGIYIFKESLWGSMHRQRHKCSLAQVVFFFFPPLHLRLLCNFAATKELPCTSVGGAGQLMLCICR